MSNKFIITAGIIFAFAAILGFKFFFPEETTNQKALETQTINDGAVAIAVTPMNIGNNSTWRFEIILDTHSGELNQNLMEESGLTDNNGNEYKPIAWNGDPPGGHHRKGILEFSPTSGTRGSVTLKIFNNSFQWPVDNL